MAEVIVPVIIKAPNQKIEDLLVKCDSNWTVHELKSHLSQVYPSKPHPNGQKLIYSGKLLLDNMRVNEVLKSYNGQQNNTIHLVCSLTRDNTYFETVPVKPSVSESSAQTSSEDVPEQSPSPEPTYETESTIFRFPDYKQTFSGRKEYSHLYAERVYLMNSYMQYISQHVNWSVTNSPPQFYLNNEEPQENVSNIVNNQPENEENVPEEERQVNRDWLDWVYLVSRLIALFTVVYFYSSPLRCIMVIAMALILYHLGMFRLRQFPINNIFNNFNNNNNNNNNNNVNDEDTIDGQPEEVVNDGDSALLIERFGWVKTIMNFALSFLLSLVPDNRDN